MDVARHHSPFVRRLIVIGSAGLGLGVALTLPCPTHGQAAPRVLRLQDFQSAAERRSPGLHAAREATAAAEAKLDEAMISPFFQFTARGATGLAPNASGVPGFTPDSQIPTDQPWGPFVNASVQGAIPLYTFGKISAARDAASAGITATTLNTQRVRNQLRFDVRRAYFALQLALDTLQMISEGRGKLVKAVRQFQQRVEDGDPDIDDFDAYRLEAALSEIDARTAEAHQVERGARAALRVLSGASSFEIPDCPIAMLQFEPHSAESHAQQGRRLRPELGMLGSAIQARRAEVRAQRASYFPDLAIALQASQTLTPGRTDQNDPFIADPANFTSLGAALVAEWNLDLWGNRARVRGAESRLAQTEAQSNLARDGIDLEIAASHAGLSEARERAEAWQRGHEQTRRWFVAAAQGYEIGAREPKELIDALKAYFTARFSHLQAMHDHNLAVARLEQTTGAALLPADVWNQTCEIDDDSATEPDPPAAADTP